MMLNLLRHIVLRVVENTPVQYFALSVYFKALSMYYGVKFVRKGSIISLSKNDNIILIKCGVQDFGATGIVVRDFKNFIESVYSDENGVINFTEPKFHKLKNGETFYFHDICEPLSTSEIYLNLAKKVPSLRNIIDLGAYCGTQTIDYSNLLGNQGKVVAIEPDTDSFNSLIKNIDRNSVHNNIFCLKKAAYSHNGFILFTNTGGMASSVAREDSDQEGCIKVECLTLEAIIKETINLFKHSEDAEV